MIQIEKDIPIPVLRVGRPAQYPFRDMAIGDSFAITGAMSILNVREAIRYFNKKTGKRFVVRKVDPFKNISRCWRIA